MKCVVVLVTLMFSVNLWASYVVWQVSGDLITLKGKVDDVEYGDQMKITFEDERTCDIAVVKISKSANIVIADSSSCSFKNELKEGMKAERNITNDGKKKTAKEDSINKKYEELPSLNESWYLYFGVGIASTSYGSELDTVIDGLETLGIDRMTLAVDVIGLYWPLRNYKTMMGFAINAVGDLFTHPTTQETLSIYQHTYSFSAQHFFGKNIGHGFFVRGDVGIVRFSAELGESRSVSELGYGALGGLGYAFPIGEETRMLINLNCAYRKVLQDSTVTLAASIGFLF